MKSFKLTKHTVWIIIAVALAVLLGLLLFVVFAEGAAEPTEPTETTTAPTTETTTAPTTQPATAPTETTLPETTVPPTTEPEPTEPPFLSFNPLTGEGLYEVSESRPYAVVFNNIKASLPQYGISQADVFCEFLVEGTTRCVGIYYDFEGVTTFGSIRSARPYMVSVAQGFDAIFVHAGRSEECQTYLDKTDWDHIDGVHGSNASKYYYRDKDRLNAGYSREHTMFIKPADVIAYAAKMKCTQIRKGGVDYGWSFAEGSAITEGENAGAITAWFNLGSTISKYVKSTALAYNEADGLYYASEYGSAWTDAGNNTQLSFRNVLILRAKTVSQGDSSGHLTITTTGSGTGYYACGGKIVAINWSRPSANDPFSFTLEDGTPLTLSIGKTYMGFVTNKGVVEYE